MLESARSEWTSPVLSPGLNRINKSEWVLGLPSGVPVNRLPFRIIYGVTLPVPSPAFGSPPWARCQNSSRPCRSNCSLWIRRRAPKCPPPLSVPEVPSSCASESVRLRSWSRSCWGTGPACLVAARSTSQKDLQGHRWWR